MFTRDRKMVSIDLTPTSDRGTRGGGIRAPLLPNSSPNYVSQTPSFFHSSFVLHAVIDGDLCSLLRALWVQSIRLEINDDAWTSPLNGDVNLDGIVNGRDVLDGTVMIETEDSNWARGADTNGPVDTKDRKGMDLACPR